MKRNPAPDMMRLFIPGIFLLCGISLAAAETDPNWKIYKREGRDYIALSQAAEVYGFALSSESGNKVLRLSNSRHVVDFSMGSREITIDGVKVWMCFPTVFTGEALLMARLDQIKTLEPQLFPERCQGVSSFTTVVLDAGHGGYDLGAVGRFGCEKDYALDIARRVRPYLSAMGLRVVMTRDADKFVPLEERAATANRSGSDAIFVSIHLNAADARTGAHGCEIFTLAPVGVPSSEDELSRMPREVRPPPGEGASAVSGVLAGCVQSSLLGHIGDYDRGIKRARYAVLRLPRMPSILVECGFLTSRSESKVIADNGWRARLAHAIAMGVYNYKNLATLKQPPLKVADFRRLK